MEILESNQLIMFLVQNNKSCFDHVWPELTVVLLISTVTGMRCYCQHIVVCVFVQVHSKMHPMTVLGNLV